MDKSEESSDKKQRRKRRNKQQVCMDILDGMARLVQKEGFCQLNISKLAKESQTDVNAILRCFGSFEGVLKAFLYQLECRYNFQQKECLETNSRSVEEYGDFFLKMLEDLRLDHSAQQALRWETSDISPLPSEYACNRESRDKQTIDRWKVLFDGSGLRIDVITAIIAGGIRYIVLNRKHALMYGVDFATREGMKQLKDTLSQLTDILVQQKEEIELKQKIAAKMKEKGVSRELIDEYLQ